jgi:ABC-type transport system involved in cytochrome c biogenesis permease component
VQTGRRSGQYRGVTFLPIFRRELAIAARRTATYRRRLVFAGLAAAMVVFLFLYLPLTKLAGPAIFKMMSWAGLILCVLEGLRATADSISRERRDGTLGLLLLTDLRAYDVLAGKLASACVLSFTTVIAMLPAFALPLLIGGVSAGECWRLMLSLLAALFLAVTVGTLVSALATSPLTAFVGSLLLVFSILVLPLVFASLPVPAPLNQIAWLSGPMEMFRRISDANFGSHVISFSLAATTTHPETFVDSHGSQSQKIKELQD